MALDAHARDLGGVLAADAAHRAERRAHAAAGAFAPVGLRLGLEEVFRLAVQSEGTVVGRVRVAVDLNRRGDLGHFAELRHDRRAELREHGHVLAVGTARSQRIRKGVLAGERAGGDGVEARVLQTRAQLGEGVIKAAVAEGHDRHGKRAVAGKAGLHKG